MSLENAFDREWQEWRRQREERLRDPSGFLAITGLHWLGEKPQRFDDVPGSWTSGADGVTVVLDEGELLRVGSQQLTGRYDFGPVDADGIVATWAESVVEIADRFGTVMLRPRHPDGPDLLGYTGTPAYEPDPSWQVTATFTAYDAPRDVEVDSVVDGRSSHIEAVGEVAFDAPSEEGGRPQRLVAFDGGDGGLWLLFTDETSGVTTYAACRQLATEPPVGGTVVLDFNRAMNMACAYTPYATCPLPPTINHIDVLVEAGEKTPHAAAGAIGP